MSLSWNEIRSRAIEFSNEFRDETSESGESQTFWNAFFHIFGLDRRRIMSFAHRVQLLGGRAGEIDLFWPGTLIVEHKSLGRNLDSAFLQALKYFEGLDENQLPKYVIVSDFKRIRLEDLEDGTRHEFELEELAGNIHLFDFVLGRTRRQYEDEHPVNIKVAELMGKLHDYLKDSGYIGHNLEILLVRLMFCLFADDTLIFEKDHFTFYLEDKTNVDGTDVGSQLTSIFQTLNKPEESRQSNIDEDLNKFPYVNGSLFQEQLEVPSFDGPSRKLLLDCCYFDWRAISPAIFGSMFQSVMDPEIRRDFGAHYTSEKI